MKVHFLMILILATASTAKCQSQKFDKVKPVHFNGSIFKIPLPSQYDYFHNSIYRNMKMSEFTKNNLLPGNGIMELEILVPRGNSDPIIQLYSFKELDSLKLSNENFIGYKKFIKTNITPSKYDSLSRTVFSDSLVKKELGNLSTDYSLTQTILETENRLTTGMLIRGHVNNKFQKLFIISNYLFINETIIVVRFTYSEYPKSIRAAVQFQNDYISELLKLK